MSVLRAGLVWLPVVATACAGELEHPERFADCGPGVVEKMFVSKCGTCHGSDAPAADLDLVSPGLVMRVVGIRSTTEYCEGQMLVDTAEPEHLILSKLTGDPVCGARMPLGGAALAAADIECVRRWIDDAIGAAP
jgi:hypothetical protein